MIDDAGYHLVTDASSDAIGAVLHWIGQRKTEPLGFFSKKLSSAERDYSTFDREMLAIFSFVKRFRHFYEGPAYTVFTYHRPLTNAIYSETNRTPKQTRRLKYISEFTTDIRYWNGTKNIVADTLSRYEIDLIDFFSLSRYTHFSQSAELRWVPTAVFLRRKFIFPWMIFRFGAYRLG